MTSWLTKFGTNPVSKLRKNDLLWNGADGVGEIGDISAFGNIIYITNNGDDTNGNGSLLAPFATGPAAEAFIVALLPTTTNRFLILDQRTGVINEAGKFIPFVSRVGNGLAELNGNWSLHSLFASIAADSFSSIAGYKSLGATTPGTVTFDISALPITYGRTINLSNFEKAVYTGAYIGNDAVDFNNLKFVINESTFNTFGRDADFTQWRSDITMRSGVIRNCLNSQVQLSSMIRSQGNVPCLTGFIIQNNCSFSGDANTGALTIDMNNILSSNQPDIHMVASNNNSGFNVSFDIINDGSGLFNYAYDVTSPYFINSINDPTGVTFSALTYSYTLNCAYQPVHYTPVATDEDGVTVNTPLLDSHLAGIDNGLAVSQLYPPNYISGFSIQVNGYTGYITTNGVCIDSTNTFNMAGSNSLACDITNPLGPGGLDAGTYVNNVEYYFYEINSSTDPDGHPPALIISASSAAPSFANAPGYNKFRYLWHAHSQSSGTGFAFVEIEGTSNERIYSIGTNEGAFTVLSGGNALSPEALLTGSVTNQYTTGVAYKYSFTSTSLTDSFSIQGVSGLVPNFTFTPGVIGVVTGITPILPVTPIGQTTYFVNNVSSSLDLYVAQLREFI